MKTASIRVLSGVICGEVLGDEMATLLASRDNMQTTPCGRADNHPTGRLRQWRARGRGSLQGRVLMMPVEFLICRSQGRIHFLHEWYELVEVL